MLSFSLVRTCALTLSLSRFLFLAGSSSRTCNIPQFNLFSLVGFVYFEHPRLKKRLLSAAQIVVIRTRHCQAQGFQMDLKNARQSIGLFSKSLFVNIDRFCQSFFVYTGLYCGLLFVYISVF